MSGNFYIKIWDSSPLKSSELSVLCSICAKSTLRLVFGIQIHESYKNVISVKTFRHPAEFFDMALNI